MFKSPVNLQEMIHIGAASGITILSILVILDDTKYRILLPLIFIIAAVLCFNYGRLSKLKKYGILSKYFFFFLGGILFILLAVLSVIL